MKRLKYLILIVLSLMIFNSCKKESLVQDMNSNTVLPSNSTMSENANAQTLTANDLQKEELCKIVAKSLDNSDFRGIIKKEAQKQFDGDYDILYLYAKNLSVSKGKTIDDYMFEAYTENKGIKASKSDYEKLVNLIPNFQISVPVNCNKWNVAEQTPLVTYIPDNFDEKGTKQVRAFDAKGNVYMLSVQDDPDVPVVVLGSCERLDYNTKNAPIDDIGGTGRGTGGGTGGGTGFSYTPNTLYLYKLSFNDLGQYETWIQGKPEICIDIHSDNSQYALGQLYSEPKRAEVNGAWKIYNHRFCSWPSTNDRLYAKCYEKDNNITTTISAGISFIYKIKIFGNEFSLTPSLTIQSKFQGLDDNMGTFMILKSDPSLGEYGNSNLMLYFKH